MNTKRKGNKAESVVLSRLILREYPVLIPFGDNEPYDIVVDTDEGLKKIQVKSGKIKNGCINVDMRQRIGAKRIASDSYYGKVDYVAVWCEETCGVYMLSGDILKQKYVSLRLDYPRTKQKHKINWANDYLLDNVL